VVPMSEMGVKLRNTQHEQMSSALPPRTDIVLAAPKHYADRMLWNAEMLRNRDHHAFSQNRFFAYSFDHCGDTIISFFKIVLQIKQPENGKIGQFPMIGWCTVQSFVELHDIDGLPRPQIGVLLCPALAKVF
jgi:hypothetical protein